MSRPRPSAGSFADFRIELFFKSTEELRTQASFLHSRGARRFNITNKKKGDPLAQWVNAALEAAPGSSVCPHWSVKQNYAKGAQGTHAKLVADLEQFAALTAQHRGDEDAGRRACDVLLVNGSGPKKAYNTVPALQQLAQDSSGRDGRGCPLVRGASMHVAFNPFFPEEADRESERDRFKAKVATGIVAGVWLQMGSDLSRLQSGIEFVKSVLAASPVPGASVYGSVFVPSKQLLAQMRFRPWNGVFLSEKYLQSVESAEAFTAELLSVYHAADVIPLVESKIATDAQLQAAMRLLSGACGVTESELLGTDGADDGTPSKRAHR